MEEIVIKSLENYARKKNPYVVLVLQKEEEPGIFKAYKKLKYTLWYINKQTKKRYIILSKELVYRITSEEEYQKSTTNMVSSFVEDLYEYLRSDKFNSILDNSYEGNE